MKPRDIKWNSSIVHGVPAHFSILWYQHLGSYMLGNFLETICWEIRVDTSEYFGKMLWYHTTV